MEDYTDTYYGAVAHDSGVVNSYDPLFTGYRRLHAAIIIRAITDYVQYRPGSQIHDSAVAYFRNVGLLEDAGIHMTGEEIMRYLDENPDALKLARKAKSIEDLDEEETV